MSPASIAVVGVGAIGGAVAADLAERGHDLLLCARSPFDRLVVRRPDGTSEVDRAACVDPTRVATPVDWVLLATKAHQSPGARPWLERLCRPGTRIAVLQNGVNHVERIAPIAPADAVLLPVVIQLPAEKTAPKP